MYGANVVELWHESSGTSSGQWLDLVDSAFLVVLQCLVSLNKTKVATNSGLKAVSTYILSCIRQFSETACLIQLRYSGHNMLLE